MSIEQKPDQELNESELGSVVGGVNSPLHTAVVPTLPHPGYFPPPPHPTNKFPFDNPMDPAPPGTPSKPMDF